MPRVMRSLGIRVLGDTLPRPDWANLGQMLKGCYPPGAAELLPRLEDPHGAPAAEGVGRTGHRLERQTTTSPLHGQRVARKHLDELIRGVHPDADPPPV